MKTLQIGLAILAFMCIVVLQFLSLEDWARNTLAISGIVMFTILLITLVIAEARSWRKF